MFLIIYLFFHLIKVVWTFRDISLLLLLFNKSCMDIPRHFTFTFIICENIFPLGLFVYKQFILKLFDVFYRLLIKPRGRSPSTLIIRLYFTRFKYQFR